MPASFRLTLAQLNPVVGALAENASRVRDAWSQARAAGADMLALPEMFLTGYQAQDLVMQAAFQDDVERVLNGLARDCADGPAIGLGAPWRHEGRLFNAWHILKGGRVATRLAKHHLPNEGVFDEHRLFDPGAISGPYAIGPLRIGTPICEDAWYPDVAEAQQESGAHILLVPNGSPYARGRLDTRMAHMVARVVETGLPLVYLNMVGGQDDQLFDGASFVLNPGGRLDRKSVV